jgi:hypothetical protein
MSGIAVAGSGEATIGLMPRYLRAREDDAGQSRPSAADAAAQSAKAAPVFDPPTPTEYDMLARPDEMRRRIAEAASPERRLPKPLLIGVGIAVLVIVAFVMFPDTLVAMLPGGSAP